MRKAACGIMVSAVVVAGFTNGCGGVGGLLPLVPVPIELGPGNGQFNVQAGVPVTKTLRIPAFDSGGITLGRGEIELDPSVITVTPVDTGGGKGRVHFQATSTLEITVWIAPLDQEQTVCEDGEQYGPFDVTLDENNVPTAVDPATVTLSSTTVDLLNGGSLSLCIQVVSPVDGTVTIDTLTFNVGL